MYLNQILKITFPKSYPLITKKQLLKAKNNMAQ